jgi:arginine decarboxylase
MHEQEGDTVSEVLSYVEYEPRRMVDGFKKTVEAAVKSGHITPRDRRMMIAAFKESINGYTYFEQ